MNDEPLRTVTPTIDIYIKLAQYPILADRVRARMRTELFDRGIVNPEVFEREVNELARTLEDSRRKGEEIERKRLEAIEPGITRVIWGPDGSVLLDESLLDDAAH